jgi:long-subunit acyl-CoA synthetase (AMP-forming)/alkylation response protein AidB-like acyl-CoA dehydrogenase
MGMRSLAANAAAAGRADHEAGAAAVVADSVAGLLAARVAATPNRAAVAVAADDRLTTWTWAELAAAALRAADELSAAGLGPGDRVAHLGSHTPDWIVVDLACLLAGLVHVPLHADATAAEHRSQLEWLAPRAVVASGGRAAAAITRGLVIAPPAGGWLPRAAVDPPRVAAAVAARAAAIDPDACGTIVLSSGTTGVPHGVLHSQRALALNARGVSDVFLPAPRDVRLSWLPASHLLARVGDLYTAIERGGCLNLVSDRKQILAACRALPPTVILGVPVFFERLEAGARSGKLGDLAAALGGEVRVCVSGGAPLRRRTAEFFAARGVPLVEGYGLAEAGPVVALSNPRIMRTGTVGPPLAGVEIKLDERPESRGQLLVKTPSRSLGVLSSQGGVAAVPEWLETGDLATLDEVGQLVITGRLKDVIVLASGVKLPPAEVERALAEDDAVAQVCVVGDGLRAPVALVVPEPAVIRRAIRRLGLVVFSRASALGHPRLVAWLARRLARRQGQLPRTWRVKRVVLVGRPFDVAHGEATESLKLKRQAIAEHFAAEIAAAGADGPSPLARPAPTGLVPALWGGGDGGFAAAAEAAAAPSASAVEAVLERAESEIAALRAAGRVYEQHAGGQRYDQHAGGQRYDQHAGGPGAVAPLDDPPPPPRGKFSAAAEAALGEAGLWGLAVPEAFGGSGATLVDLARAITRLAADVPTAAGMLAVHSSIGAVSALTAFGTSDQQARHLPGLAAGRPLSIFGATESDAGCDLARVQSVLERREGRLVLSGTKMFITGATYGRLVKLLALHEGRPAVVLVQLPEADTATFRLRHYPLHPLKQAQNAALEFTGFEVDEADLLTAPGEGDGMPIVWHGLNRGRTTLAAQAAGTLRLLLAHAAEHARRRTTWGRPIASRQLVQGRLGRIAASITACDALASWAAAAVDAGGGEWEAITAKVVASGCVREAAIDALGIHGGRAFLVGHPLGDSFHDHFAVGVYEGESELLGLALFRGLAKGHPLATRHPLAVLGRDAGGLPRAAGWLAWRAGAWSRGGHRDDAAILDRGLRGHARAARRGLARAALAVDRAIRRHGRGLAERQLEIGILSAVVRDLASVLAAAHHADASGDEQAVASADVWCRLALARAAGRRPGPAVLSALAALGAAAVGGNE